MEGPQLMAPSTRHRGVRRISGDRVDSIIGLTADKPGGVSSIFAPPLPIPPTQCLLWHFEHTQHEKLCNFLFDFPWDDYCFQSLNPDQNIRC
ncbi:hypothetical protein SK128_020481 [Halocaridina rubra]|uniref:Uncharacterized protein n=1 Tax=Halocaridina rubra TaxID=373956 RepID=A0AAN8XKC0_HALRR